MIDAVEQVGLDVHVEPSVTVVVAKRRHHRCVCYHGQTTGRGFFLEGAVTLVEVEQIGGIVPADIDVQQPVIVHVNERRPLLPDSRRLALVFHPGLRRHLFEFPVAEIAKQPATLRLADHKYVRPAVVIIVADRDPGADCADSEFVKVPVRHAGILVPRRGFPGIGIVVFGDDAGVGGRTAWQASLRPLDPASGANGCATILPGASAARLAVGKKSIPASTAM